MAMVITHSQTPDPNLFYRQADILITTTGKPIVNAANIKPGSILLNFGYHQSEQKTYGDYLEKEVESVASYYTPVLKGTGPIMLSYLMRNIIESYAKQVK
jgi:methylenetetrahydrofolate dehydrogenase (NADP+)/methenyltetrahydrofolate cyclohydrolase